jgi:hypothetical protein
MTSLRSVRVGTAPVQIRLAGVIGRLVNISATGALVQLQSPLAPERRDGSLLLNVEPEPVELRVRLVYTHVVSVHLPEAEWGRKEHAVAVTFMELPPKPKEAIRKLCGDAFHQQE